MFCPSISDCIESTSLGYDTDYYLYSVHSVSDNNENRLSFDYGRVWASEIHQSERYFQSYLVKPTVLAISYNDVQNWINQKLNAFKATVRSIADSIVNGAKSALNAAINAVKSTASSAYNKAVSLGTDIANKARETLSSAQRYADSAISVAKSALNTAINAAKSTASNAYNKAVEVANSVSSKVSSVLGDAKRYADGLVKKYDNFISGINGTVKNIIDPIIKPFNDFAKGINNTVNSIIEPVLKPIRDAVNGISNTVNKAVDLAVKPFNDFINGFNDKINGFLKPIIDKINNLPKDLLKQVLEQAKNHFKGILDNFKSGIDTIKSTIDSILSNINTLNSFKTDTNNRLTNLENNINNFGRLYVTQTSFNTFKSDVDKRIKLLNTAVSSINSDLKSAFQSFNLSLIDTSNKIVSAINSMSVNLGNLLIPINDKLNRVITFLTDLNSENGILSKISQLINNVTLFSKLDSIKSSIDNLAKKDIFDNILFKALEKWFSVDKINNLSDTLNNIYDYLNNYLKTKLDTISIELSEIGSFKNIFIQYISQVISKLSFLITRVAYLIKTVQEIEIPKEENNTTVNKEAETNIWDVAKELLKTLQEFIKNPAKLVELLIGFIKDLIVPHDINFFSDFRSEVSTKFDKKLPFVGQFKNSFVAAFNSPKTFNDYTLSYNFLKFSGSVVVPIHYLNDFGAIAKPYITAFLVFGFLITMYSWFLNRGAKLNDD